VHDFKVRIWADKRKTVPRVLHTWCETCKLTYDRQWHARNPPNRRRGDHEPEHVVEARRALKEREKEQRQEKEKLRVVFSGMSREDRFSYQLDDGLPLNVITGGWSLATEDYDPTPVMDVTKECPKCYLRGGSPCITCPDANVKENIRAARKQGLVLTA